MMNTCLILAVNCNKLCINSCFQCIICFTSIILRHCYLASSLKYPQCVSISVFIQSAFSFPAATVEPSRLQILDYCLYSMGPSIILPRLAVEPSRLHVTTVWIPWDNPSSGSRDCWAIQNAHRDYCLNSIGPSYYETFMHSGHYHYSSGQPALTDPVTNPQIQLTHTDYYGPVIKGLANWSLT